MDFKEIRRDWKNVKAGRGMNFPEIEETLLDKIERLQTKIVFQNLLVSIAFGLTFMVIGWVWSNFGTSNKLVAGSLISLGILLLLTIFLFWKRVLFWRNLDYSADTMHFIDKAVRKLMFNLRITRYFMPLYGLFLTTAVVLYEWAILNELTTQWKLLIIAGTIVFNLLIFTIGIYRKRRKDAQQIVPLVEELLNIRNTLSGATS